MKICFVQQAYRIQFGIMYLSAICKSKGIETDVYIYNYDKTLPEADIYAVSSSTVSYKEDLRIIKRIKRLTHKPIIIGGPHPTYYAKEVAKEDCIDSIVIGEGYEAIIEYAQGNRKTVYHPREIFDINNLPMPDYGLYYSKYDLKNSLTKSVYIVRGCSFKCLSGETEINTAYGMIKIKELSEKYETIPVLTRDKKTHELLFVDAINIMKTRTDAELVRVEFDDNTYIECTPDHKFMTFKNGNQFIDIEEKEIEAKDLKPYQRIRAVKYDNQLKYTYVSGNRYNQRTLHRIIGEWKYKKTLNKNEIIHHIDKNTKNNNPDNLKLVDIKEHISYHRQDRSERMKINNAAKNMSKEQRILNGKMQKGIKRNYESRVKYSLSKKGVLNPNYKHGKNINYRSRLDDGNNNHKVIRVIKLEKKEDVYCLEMPGYDWFYANNVLVHNCSFCYNPAYNALYNGKGKTIQCMDVKKAISEIKELKKKWGFKWLQFMSDTMNMNKEWFIKLLKEYKKQIGGKYICNVRANLVDEELVKVMAYTGCDRVDFGVEHGDEAIRNKILKRNMSDNQMINAGRLFKKYGIRVQTTNIFCLPTENLNKAIKTVKLNQKIKPEIAKACILQPFENTEIYQYAKDFNILKNTDIISGTTYQRDYDGRDGVSKIVIEDEKKIIRLSYLLDWFVQRPYLNWAIKLIVSLPIDSIVKGYYNSLFSKQEKKYTRSK